MSADARICWKTAVLPVRALNRALLHRQGLLARTGWSVDEAIEHLVGVPAQAPLAPYVGLWSRIDSFDPESLSARLLDRRVVRATAMLRTTIHLHTADDALGMARLRSRTRARRWPAGRVRHSRSLLRRCRSGRLSPERLLPAGPTRATRVAVRVHVLMPPGDPQLAGSLAHAGTSASWYAPSPPEDRRFVLASTERLGTPAMLPIVEAPEAGTGPPRRAASMRRWDDIPHRPTQRGQPCRTSSHPTTPWRAC